MNRYRLIGLVIALLLLIAALMAKYWGGEQLMAVMLPILTVGLWVLTAVDWISYRKDKNASKAIRGVELTRLISLGVISLLLTVAVLLSYIL